MPVAVPVCATNESRSIPCYTSGMEPELTPSENFRKVTSILGLMVGVIPLAFYSYNVERNVRTQKTLTKSCELVRSTLASDLDPQTLAHIYGPAALNMRIALDSSVEAYCVQIDGELSWWLWNLNRRVELDAPAAHSEKVGELPAQTAQLCLNAFTDLELLACKRREMFVRTLVPVPDAQLSPWTWASRLGTLATYLSLHGNGTPKPISPY